MGEYWCHQNVAIPVDVTLASRLHFDLGSLSKHFTNLMFKNTFRQMLPDFPLYQLFCLLPGLFCLLFQSL